MGQNNSFSSIVFKKVFLHQTRNLKSTSAIFLPGISLCLLLTTTVAYTQPITGVWKGKVRSTRVELKLIKKGDSLVGTSYYYETADSYRRYTVKGYFDDANNNVVWWDDVLVADKSSRNAVGKEGMMAVADFNCPGEGVMRLDGNLSPRDESTASKLPLNLQKTTLSVFPDEWDYVLKNYTLGANDPDLIDSVSLVATGVPSIPIGYEAAPVAIAVRKASTRQLPETTTINVPRPEKEEIKMQPSLPLTVEQKFTSRTKILQSVIPLTGDSIELRFYDNAEIDGDSIAVYLNNHLLEEHILLSDQPHTLKIAVSDLAVDNELVMVAENLGSIPPNTSLMVAIVGDNRYEARLQSTEGSSALVRFVKELKK